MILYEVNITVDESIKSDYLAWLGDHIREILAITGFTGATLLADTSSQLKFTVVYCLTDEKALKNYLDQYAPKLRKEATDKFGDRFVAQRRVFEVQKTY